MSAGQLSAVVRHIRRLARPPDVPATDQALLRRFAAEHDEAAFEELVERHGRLVWGVCRRVLHHTHDAEDVFQATFLVLARKAGAVRWRDSVGGWLYAVAYRLASEARRRAARRQLHEQRAGQVRAAAPASACQELCSLLDDELGRLPSRLRVPLLLCYLEGLTGDQAARQLGWSQRTLQRRLAQGRELLRGRLARRGVTLSAALLAPALQINGASAAVPAALAASTTPAAVAFVCGSGGMIGGGGLMARVFLRGMAMSRLKWVGVLVFALGTAGAGGVLYHRGLAAGEPNGFEQQAAPKPKDEKPAAADKDARADADPFARHAWAIIDLAATQHLQPPARDEVIVAGAKAMLLAAKQAPPDDLGRRAAAVQSAAQLAGFLNGLWPKGADVPPRQNFEASFLAAVLARIPGEAKVVPTPDQKIAEQISGNRYVGIGIQIGVNKEEDRPQVQVAMRRGAARAAGIKAGDLILQVDGKDTKGVPLPKIVDWLRAEEGTTVTLLVRQPGAAEPRTYKMTRAVVPFDSLAGYRRTAEDRWDYHAAAGEPIAYVRIDSVRSSTLHELRQVERTLKADGYRAVVLDLRTAHGSGLIQHAALVADGLLDGGLLWRAHSGAGAEPVEYHADRDCLFRGWPMAVLISENVDQNDALVAAALQDNGRAVLVGQPTKTDGYLNSLIPLPDGKGNLVLRTGRLERAAKDRGWPLKPDHEAPLTPEQQAALGAWHRANEIAEGPVTDSKSPEDPQLAKAVELLRGRLKALDSAGKP